jgi:hypothetical protein
LTAVGLLAVSVLTLADDRESALDHLVAKSHLVVAGNITSEPVGLANAASVKYGCDLTVTEVFKGPAKPDDRIQVSIVRIILELEDKPIYLQRGCTCILFLRPVDGIPAWETVDLWFGIQQYYPALARSLRSRAEAKKR